MQQAKHVKAGKRGQREFYVILLVVLVCVIFGAILIPQSVGKQSSQSPAGANDPMVSPDNTSKSEAELSSSSVNDGREVGTLLDSGSDLNSNFFAKIDASGSIFNLTDSSFDIEPMTLGADIITAHYDENTVVKIANLYYNSDTYEIYMGSLDDIQRLKDDVKYMFNIVFENSDDSEPRAKEIIISTYADLV